MSTIMKLQLVGVVLLALALGGCGDEGSPVTPDPTAASEASTARLDSAASSLRAQDDPLPENFPFRKILCFGDSITLGVTQRSESPVEGARSDLVMVEGYVPKLWRMLEERYGVGFELVNAGLGGETSTEGLDRIDFEIRTHQPDLILLMHGIVDVNNAAPRYPVVRANLNEMMRLGQLRGAFVIAGTYPLVSPDGFRNSGAGNVPRLNTVVRQEANDRSVPLADHEMKAGRDFRSQGPDGLHPNNLGYEIIAESWMETIEEVLLEMGVS